MPADRIVSVPLRGKGSVEQKEIMNPEDLKKILEFPSPCGERVLLNTTEIYDQYVKVKACFRPLAGKGFC